MVKRRLLKKLKTKKGIEMNQKLMTGLVLGGIVCLASLILFFVLVDVTTVKGNEVGVLETWNGIDEKPLFPKTYTFFPGFLYKVYPYDMSSQVFVMNNKKPPEDSKTKWAESYLIQSADQQDLHISMNIRWRLDPAQIVNLHKQVRENFEEKILRTELLRVVKDFATMKKAIDAYTGQGLVDLQSQITKVLTDPQHEMRKRGIIVENFVIEGITLDPEYIGEIKKRQVAVQKEQRQKAEQIAALAEAEKVKAEAQADYNKQLVEAKRDKEMGVMQSEMKAEQEVLKAEAAKKQVVLAAEGEKESAELKSQAILAMGKAEAEAKKLQLSAYAVPGADAFVKIEISKNVAEGFKNIKGYLPSDMKINLLSDSFMSAIQNLVGTKEIPAPTK